MGKKPTLENWVSTADVCSSLLPAIYRYYYRRVAVTLCEPFQYKCSESIKALPVNINGLTQLSLRDPLNQLKARSSQGTGIEPPLCRTYAAGGCFHSHVQEYQSPFWVRTGASGMGQCRVEQALSWVKDRANLSVILGVQNWVYHHPVSGTCHMRELPAILGGAYLFYSK